MNYPFSSILKTAFVSVWLVAFANCSYSQDVIYFLNGDELEAKIIEIGTSQVKYKRFDYLTGPDFKVDKSTIFKIKYENGVSDVFSGSGSNQAQSQPAQPAQPAQPVQYTQPTRQTTTSTIQRSNNSTQTQNTTTTSSSTPDYNIVGNWKSTSGAKFYVERYSGNSLRYKNIRNSGYYYLTRRSKNRYSTSSYNFDVISSNRIELQSKTNSSDRKTWTRYGSTSKPEERKFLDEYADRINMMLGWYMGPNALYGFNWYINFARWGGMYVSMRTRDNADYIVFQGGLVVNIYGGIIHSYLGGGVGILPNGDAAGEMEFGPIINIPLSRNGLGLNFWVGANPNFTTNDWEWVLGFGLTF